MKRLRLALLVIIILPTAFNTAGSQLISSSNDSPGTSNKKGGKDWGYILKSFKDQKTNFGNAITEKTWKKDYKSCVMALEVMAQKNPPIYCSRFNRCMFKRL